MRKEDALDNMFLDLCTSLLSSTLFVVPHRGLTWCTAGVKAQRYALCQNGVHVGILLLRIM